VFKIRQPLRWGLDVFTHIKRFESYFKGSLVTWSYAGEVIAVSSVIAKFLKKFAGLLNAVERIAWDFDLEQFHCWRNLSLLFLYYIR
jgi:hypothetical protein